MLLFERGGREEEREWNTDRLHLVWAPEQGTNLQPRQVPCLGIEQGDLSLCRTTPNRATPGGVHHSDFKLLLLDPCGITFLSLYWPWGPKCRRHVFRARLKHAFTEFLTVPQALGWGSGPTEMQSLPF